MNLKEKKIERLKLPAQPNESEPNSRFKHDPWVEVELARRRLAPYLRRTLLIKGFPIEGLPKTNLYYKCDHLRRTGAYKERGGLNALLKLSPEDAKRGVIAASAGNHAQALAYHGAKLKIPVTVVMPVTAPIVKVERCKKFGAEVVLHGPTLHEAKEMADRMSEERKLKYINGFDDPDIISGAGTCGLEILSQLPEVDVIVVPVGGGGLLSGVALAVKRLNPKIKVIGVETDRCPGMSNSLRVGKPTFTPVAAGGTIAEGLAVSMVGGNAFRIIQEYVDEIVVVPEAYIAQAILHLLEAEKLLVEGAGCAGLAAILSGQINDLIAGKNVVTILCGGNIDIDLLGSIIDKGLYQAGRLVMFDCAISNRVGGLACFVNRLSETGASVKEIVQDSPFIQDARVVSVHVRIETTSREHWKQINEHMRKAGFVLKPHDDKKYSDVDFSKL